jgi:hypothetical protein
MNKYPKFLVRAGDSFEYLETFAMFEDAVRWAAKHSDGVEDPIAVYQLIATVTDEIVKREVKVTKV